jgi:hypothetical protein
VVRDASAEAWARDGGRWVEARLAGERQPAVRRKRGEGGAWRVVDFDPSRPHLVARAAADLRGGGGGSASGPGRRTITLAALAMALMATAAAVAPSHLRVENPASPSPELVVSFKLFGTLLPAGAVDAAAEAAKPVHMRGRTAEKPRRAPVVVRLTVDGVVEERAFAAKGVSHDGPAMGEWRQAWAAGEHDVVVEIFPGGAAPVRRWAGRVRAEPRRLQVITFDEAGFGIE